MNGNTPSPIEIQRAHDILHFLGMPGAPAIVDAPQAVQAAHDVLAWVLGFPCGEAFGNNLLNIEQLLRALGYREIDMGAPTTMPPDGCL